MEQTRHAVAGELTVSTQAGRAMSVQRGLTAEPLPSQPLRPRSETRCVLPVWLCGPSQCHDFLGSSQLWGLATGPRSSQKQHHCQSPTVTQNTRVRLQVQVRYLPGNVTHGDTMLLHAALPSVIRGVSYFIRGGRRTVYPPLREKKNIFSQFPDPKVFRWASLPK